MVHCSAYGCKHSNPKNGELSFFRFPLNKPEVKQWIRNCGRVDWKPTQFSMLCSAHFEETCIQEDMYLKIMGQDPNGKRRRKLLKPGAVPTIFNFKSIPTKLPKHRKFSIARAAKAKRKEMIDQLLSAHDAVSKSTVGQSKWTMDQLMFMDDAKGSNSAALSQLKIIAPVDQDGASAGIHWQSLKACTLTDNSQIQCSTGYQVLPGFASVKSEIDPVDAFLRLNETSPQTDQSQTEDWDTQTPVRIVSYECDSSTGEPKKWVVCNGGVLKEVVPVDTTEETVETPTDGHENIPHNNGVNPEVNGMLGNISSVYTEHPPQRSDQEQSVIVVTPDADEDVTVVTPYSCNACGKPFLKSRTPLVKSNKRRRRKTVSNGAQLQASEWATISSTVFVSFPNGRDPICHRYSDILPKPTGVKRNSCKTCGESFTGASDLEVHDLEGHDSVDTSETENTCSTCDTRTLRSDTHKMREQNHPSCPCCGVSFPYRSYIKLHHNYTLPV